MRIKENYGKIVNELREVIDAKQVEYELMNRNINVDEYNNEDANICFELTTSEIMKMPSNIAYYFQHHYSYPSSIRENLFVKKIEINIIKKKSNKVYFKVRFLQGFSRYTEQKLECHTLKYLIKYLNEKLK